MLKQTNAAEKVAQVEQLKKQGMHVKAACRQAGISSTYYYNIKAGTRRPRASAKSDKPKTPAKRMSKPTLLTIPAAQHTSTGRVLAFYCRTEDVGALIRGLE